MARHGRPGQPVRRHGGRSALRAGAARLRARGVLGRADRARPAQGGDRASWREDAAKTRRIRARVAEYKAILKAVLESRPSGMRQRLAEAIGKNRSFVSQISNPAYQVPIPARHVALIFEICHFSAARAGRVSQGLFAGAPGPARRSRPRRAARTQDHARAAGPWKRRQEPAARNAHLRFRASPRAAPRRRPVSGSWEERR